MKLCLIFGCGGAVVEVGAPLPGRPLYQRAERGQAAGFEAPSAQFQDSRCHRVALAVNRLQRPPIAPQFYENFKLSGWSRLFCGRVSLTLFGEVIRVMRPHLMNISTLRFYEIRV